MSKRIRPTLTLMMALALLAAIPAQTQDLAAEDAARAPGPAVAERLVGTMLQIEPRAGYERAVLRVAGPQGYALATRFAPGAPVEADLLAEAEERRAAGPEERESRERASPSRAPWPALPEGEYVYELLLTAPAGGSRVHVGYFRVENGAATLRERPHSERAPEGARSTRGPELSEKSVTELDFIKIDDDANDGTTFLTLDSDDSTGTALETWGLFNRFGNFSLEECGNGGNLGVCQLVQLGILDDQNRTRIGLGTAAPGDDDLHISSTVASIRLDDTDGSSWRIQEIGGGLELFLLSPDPGHPGHIEGPKVYLDGSGNLGIGRSDPTARLHVGGDAIITGDVALGSSRTIKHDVDLVEPAAMLAAVRELPVYSWRYEADPVQALHIGPMAEDVHAAFRVGRDDQHLSPGDSAGLALAAIQGVDAELRRLRESNRELARRLAELEWLLAAPRPSCP